MTKNQSFRGLSIPKWLRVLIPSIIIIVWLAAASIGGPYFGKISEVSTNDQSTFLPSSAESTKVNEQIGKYKDQDAVPAIVVFSNDNKVLTDEQTAAIKQTTQSLTNIAEVKGDISPPVVSDDKKAALVVVNIDSAAEFKDVVAELRADIDGASLSTSYKITGPVGFLNDLSKAFAGIDGLLIIVALSVVFVILLVVYRSPLLPFIVLFTAISALAASILVVWHLADAGIIQINGQVQGILFILVIGAATDYSLLYVSRFREELERHKHTWNATKTALKRSFEPILAAGGTVIAGLMCLLLSDLNSNKALGPVGSIGIALAILSALTLLPAILTAVGRKAFWPRAPRHSIKPKLVHKDGIWKKVGGFVSRHPRRIWMISTVALLLCVAGTVGIKADGVAQSDLVLGTSEARDGQEIIDRHFPSGSGSPAQIIVSASSTDEIVAKIDNDKGVDSVTIVANNSPSGTMPIGKNEASIKQRYTDEITKSSEEEKVNIRSGLEQQMAGAPAFAVDETYNQVIANIPSVDTIVQAAYPFKNATPKIVDQNVFLEVTLTDDADSKEAQDTVARLRNEVHAIDDNALIGGTSAVQLDTNNAAIHDRAVVIPAVLVVITIILMLLLRSIVAPVILLLTTIVSFAATLGVATLLFNHVLQFPGADPSVVLYGFVFLVALGIDYNIFLMTRVREESLKVGTRKGVVAGLIVTGGVITSAGIVLAATFAALAVIPILFLAQLAFIVAFGVLLDTTVVRSLLVPSIIYDLGKRSWWPAKNHKD